MPFPASFILSLFATANPAAANDFVLEDFHHSPLRCPASWHGFLLQLQGAEALLGANRAAEAREKLGDAISSVLGTGSGESELLRKALTECAVGLGSAFRLNALAHVADPLIRRDVEVQQLAMEVALRFQHLAAGWLIYAYNGPARHRDAFIDDSLWPINSHQFGEEHRAVAAFLKEHRSIEPQPSTAVTRASVVMVTICDYPSDSLLPRLASFVHGLYAQHHGYAYRHHRSAYRSAENRPAAWGKILAMQDALQEGNWDWALWVDCDLFFMDLNRSLESILWRYATMETKMLISEDAQTLNTAIFFMRRSEWSVELLKKVWGDDNERTSPFVDHTWWEQQAFAQELLGSNVERFAKLRYEEPVTNGSQVVQPGELLVYPPEVSIVPQEEMNSYHPISSRLVGETWEPGKFILSFNGVKSLSGPTVANVLHVNYFEVFCQLNGLEQRCQAPWGLGSTR